MSDKSKLKRVPKRAIYERKEAYKIVDANYICHLAFVHNDVPVSIPTMYGREGDAIYLHGAMASRLLNELEKGFDVSLSIAKVNGLVLARSAFHHSLNYESVVIFGKGKLVAENDKMHALKVISDNLLKNRWEEARLPNKKELHATKVIAISIDEITGKVRNEGVNDNKEDLDLPIWAGIVPIEQKFRKPIHVENLSNDIEIPKSVKALYDQ